MVLCILTTIIFTPSLTIDAFNPPKFLVMCLGIFYVILRNRKFLIGEFQNNSLGITLLLGITISLLVLVLNNYSFSERFFGIERRNFGFITVISFFTLGAISYAAGRAKVIESRRIHLGLMIANLFVSLIFFMQLSGAAFTEFNNDYGLLPSTLGNPNFLAAFLAVSITGILGWISHPLTQSKWKYFAMAQVIASIWIMAKTQSIQGFAALAVGAIALLHFLVRKVLPRQVYWFLSTITLAGAALFFCGVLGFGINIVDGLPPTLLYRTVYWKMGVQMLKESPFLGSGFDSYLDNFRTQLQSNYFSTLGPGVVSDSPHNIFLDYYVSGGLMLGLFVTFCVSRSLVKCFKYLNEAQIKKIQISSDEFMVSILIMYLAIACISPFQLSLFIWLPVIIGLTGSFDAGSESKSMVSKAKESGKKKFKTTSVWPILIISICVNPLVALLPVVTEMRYRSAVESGNFYDLKDVALAWPFSGARANAIAEGMLNSSFGLNSSPDESTQKQLQIFRDTAIDLVTSASTVNPNHFETWRFLLANSSSSETKLLALKNLRRLDPHNPEWRSNSR